MHLGARPGLLVCADKVFYLVEHEIILIDCPLEPVLLAVGAASMAPIIAKDHWTIEFRRPTVASLRGTEGEDV